MPPGLIPRTSSLVSVENTNFPDPAVDLDAETTQYISAKLANGKFVDGELSQLLKRFQRNDAMPHPSATNFMSPSTHPNEGNASNVYTVPGIHSPGSSHAFSNLSLMSSEWPVFADNDAVYNPMEKHPDISEYNEEVKDDATSEMLDLGAKRKREDENK